MPIKKLDKEKSTHAERASQGSLNGVSWGDNGPARPTTQAYKDGWDRIFGKKTEEGPTIKSMN